MKQARSSLWNDSPWRDGPTRRSIVRVVTSFLGAAVVLLVLYSAGVDPWRWWLDYRRESAAARSLPDRTTPPRLVSAVQPQPIGTDSSVSTIRQPLTLTAIGRGRNAREGYVDLGVNWTSPQTYRAGAILANGARIAEIYTDYIVLERDDQRTKLYLMGHRPLDAPNRDSPLLFVGGAAPARPTVAISHDALTDVMRVTPVYQGDSVHAIEVFANDRSDAFSRLGLEPGDRITSINGERVMDATSAIATLRRLTQGEAMQVTVERQGTLQALSLDGLVVTATQSVPTG